MKSIVLNIAVSSAIFAGAFAFADEAANAYVTVKGPDAKTSSGLDFSVKGETDTVVVNVKPQPGWELTSPAVQSIPKGSAGHWKARSFYGESDAGGEICIPTTTVTTNHISAPHFNVSLDYSCEYEKDRGDNGNHGNNGTEGNTGVGQGSDLVGQGNNGNGKGIPGNDPNKGDKEKGNDKDRDGKLSFAAAAINEKGGHHKVVTVTETCPGGKSNKKSRDTKDVTTNLDEYKWTWSCGPHSGTENGQSLVVGPLDLPAGQYTLTVTLTAKCRDCPSCTYSKSAKKNINVK